MVGNRGIDAPICQDKRLGCQRDVSAHAEVCHNTLVEFTGEEAFEAADDLASGPAASRPAGDVVDRRRLWCMAPDPYFGGHRQPAGPVVPTENLIRTVRVTDRADVGPANDGNVRIAAVHSVNVDEWLASFGRSSGRRAACTVFRRRPSMAVVRPRDDGSCGAGRPRAASP